MTTLATQLLAFLAQRHASEGDVPVHIGVFCAETGHAPDAARPAVQALYAESLVSTFIGSDFIWLTPAGLAQAGSLEPASPHAEARALLGNYLAALADSADPRAAHWSLALQEMAADDAALARLQVTIQALLAKA